MPSHVDLVGERHRDDVGQVVLALRVVVLQVAEITAQRPRIEGDETGVDLVHAPLVVGRVLVLDDARDGAALVAQHAAVARRVVDQRRQQRELAARAVGDEALERLRPNQRHVAAQHEHSMVVGNRRHGLHDGMARAELLGLQRPLEIGLLGERRSHLLGAVAVDDVDARGLDGARGADDVLEQRPARERLQHLRQCRVHAFALARGENDYGNRHQPGTLQPFGLGIITRPAARRLMHASRRRGNGAHARGVRHTVQ